MTDYTTKWTYNNYTGKWNERNAYEEYFNLSNFPMNTQIGASIFYGYRINSYAKGTFYVTTGVNGAWGAGFQGINQINNISSESIMATSSKSAMISLYNSSGSRYALYDNAQSGSGLTIIENKPRKIKIFTQSGDNPSDMLAYSIGIKTWDVDPSLFVENKNNITQWSFDNNNLYFNGNSGSLTIVSSDTVSGNVCSTIATLQMLKDGVNCNFSVQRSSVSDSAGYSREVIIAFNQPVAVNQLILTY